MTDVCIERGQGSSIGKTQTTFTAVSIPWKLVYAQEPQKGECKHIPKNCKLFLHILIILLHLIPECLVAFDKVISMRVAYSIHCVHVAGLMRFPLGLSETP